MSSCALHVKAIAIISSWYKNHVWFLLLGLYYIELTKDTSVSSCPSSELFCLYTGANIFVCRDTKMPRMKKNVRLGGAFGALHFVFVYWNRTIERHDAHFGLNYTPVNFHSYILLLLCVQSCYSSWNWFCHDNTQTGLKCNKICSACPFPVSVCSMLPLFLKDGLLVPYIVTSLGFLFFSIYLLSALDHCSEDKLRLGAYNKLFYWVLKMDLAFIVRWKVSIEVLL